MEESDETSRRDRAMSSAERRYWKSEAFSHACREGEPAREITGNRTRLFATNDAAEPVSRAALLMTVADRFERSGSGKPRNGATRRSPSGSRTRLRPTKRPGGWRRRRVLSERSDAFPWSMSHARPLRSPGLTCQVPSPWIDRMMS